MSKAVRELLEMRRLHLAIEEYKKGTASLGKASKLAGVSISRMMDILTEYGVESNLELEDYLSGLKNLEASY